MTSQDEIEKVHGNGVHLVILGAGASIASTLRDPELNGKVLPAMNNIVDIVGLQDIVSTLPKDLQALSNDFEKMYSKLYDAANLRAEKEEIENRIYDYFKDLKLPETPTIYDYLVISLRHNKDVIATFNWDPFLYQAYVRNGEFTKSPGILHLHGNVALGFCEFDRTIGPAGWTSKATLKDFEPTRLLYPVEKKNYNSDTFTTGQWEALQDELKVAQRVTVFGYRAPQSDIEAIQIMQNAWGTPDDRAMEQFELIDIRKEEDVKASWDKFIHSHHYDYHTDFFKSSIARHPRRSVESYHHWSMPMTPSEAFQDGNPVPQNFKTLEEMWDWYKPLVEAEEKFYNDK
ncbi:MULTISPECIES: hypothetical protein [unclassified Arcicella]|uniref:hypothetical protein n=1 Tax=unclassified Arcicella TaxID=2644986 RepID=UPI00285F48B3|nr:MULTISPECIES: hypothetical protein [unclassified Arcicella]MDR6563752.1 hypothetical protein [Arcicella sp. BE51]MDR6813564.1 hypothetical protein [Arcicella sp. BE140]MDR6824876.1 hypothetical protein [Arcicella sp. BE139]